MKSCHGMKHNVIIIVVVIIVISHCTTYLRNDTEMATRVVIHRV